jgi:hypothetical protein
MNKYFEAKDDPSNVSGLVGQSPLVTQLQKKGGGFDQDNDTETQNLNNLLGLKMKPQNPNADVKSKFNFGAMMNMTQTPTKNVPMRMTTQDSCKVESEIGAGTGGFGTSNL